VLGPVFELTFTDVIAIGRCWLRQGQFRNSAWARWSNVRVPDLFGAESRASQKKGGRTMPPWESMVTQALWRGPAA
jgi:hypothetical protein